MSGAVLSRPRDPLDAALDRLDPPSWGVADRAELEPHQIPPIELLTGESDFWLMEGGRGSGKTEGCARYFAKYMHENPGHRGRIIAPTFGDAVESCIEGPSGLQAMDPDVSWLPSAPGGAKVKWANGSEALVLGTPFPKDVDRLRAGGNRHLDWWEEAAANPQLAKARAQAEFGLRLGRHPHSIGSSTPRTTKAYKELRLADGVTLTHGTMFDNPHNPSEWVEKMMARYAGTRLEKQELQGLLIEDVEGALWDRARIEASRVEKAPELSVVVVAVDPAATSGPDADDTGIIVIGLGVDGEGYILADQTCHLDPDGWATRAIRAFHNWEGDRVVPEVNNGGEMVETILRDRDPLIPVKPVTASRGKTTRAEPVAGLWGDGKKRKPRVHLVGGFPELEDQLCTWVPGDPSPDRLDAMVWGLTDVMLQKQGSWRPL